MDKFVIKCKRDSEGNTASALRPIQLSERNRCGSDVESILTSKSDEDPNVNCRRVDEHQENCANVTRNLSVSFPRWQKANPWLELNANKKAICTTCTEALEKKLILSYDSRALKSKEAWVDTGFNNWNNATSRIKKHSTSSLHVDSTETLAKLKTVNIIQHLSSATEKQMMNHRTALRKIFSTLKVLAKQGLPLRGINNDENSNFIQILKARAEDVSELESWLKRDGHKWLHHDVQNEILELMAAKVMAENLVEIRQAEFCALLLDETSDLSKMEQISICLRVVSQNLVSSEFFLGFYSTSSTKTETLFQIVQDVFLRLNLPLTKLRGQCYDGAANVSGKITGLQRRLREIEPRALYVHCNAHNLNLVVQDAMEGVPATRKFIGVVKDMINFIKDSPKRISQFQQLQSESESSTNKNLTLAAYCPTRWVMRISSLKTVRANYEPLMKFFVERITDCEVDSIISAKASGYFEHMRTFEFFFFLTIIIELLDRIEILNKDLQNSELSVNDSYRKIEGVIYCMNVSRDSKFEIIWQKSNNGVKELDIDEPQLPRQRKIPKRLDSSNSENLVFKTLKEMYRKIYFEIYDRVLTSLNSRFDTEAARFIKSLEAFAVGESTNVAQIINFYGDDFEEDRLVSDRDVFLNLTSRSNVKISNLREIVNFFRKNEWSMGLIPDYVKFIKLLMTIPGSSCTNERSFSTLRRLKNYLRTTMLQDRLNHVAILHIYSNITDKLDMEVLMDEFIARNVKRTAVFALSKK